MNFILLGLGGRSDIWIEAVRAMPETELIAYVEVNESISAQKIERFKLDPQTVFTTLDDALAYTGDDVDALLDVTPPQFHLPYALRAFELGLPVLAEKPLSDDRETAIKLAKHAQDSGLLYLVAQNYRYKTEVQTLKHALADMGPISSVHVSFFKGVHFPGFRQLMPYPLITDMSIHHFDLMRYFLESDPVCIYGQAWRPPHSDFNGKPGSAVLIEFANGVHVSYQGSWSTRGQETTWAADWRFECEQGVVIMKDDVVSIQRYEKDAGWINQYYDLEIVSPVSLPRDEVPQVLYDFYHGVVGNESTLTSAQDNIKSITMVFDAIESIETGQAIIRKDNQQ